mmetsp:Transcript_15312/g.52454  ORF Transcript_15312/g.52454 Transcript_15312/m.52454 type:complete len:286 (+) Transcript_15312:62-919(+)
MAQRSTPGSVFNKASFSVSVAAALNAAQLSLDASARTAPGCAFSKRTSTTKRCSMDIFDSVLTRAATLVSARSPSTCAAASLMMACTRRISAATALASSASATGVAVSSSVGRGSLSSVDRCTPHRAMKTARAVDILVAVVKAIHRREASSNQLNKICRDQSPSAVAWVVPRQNVLIRFGEMPHVAGDGEVLALVAAELRRKKVVPLSAALEKRRAHAQQDLAKELVVAARIGKCVELLEDAKGALLCAAFRRRPERCWVVAERRVVDRGLEALNHDFEQARLLE